MELFKILGRIAIDNDQANNSLDETASKAKSTSGKIASALGKVGGVVGKATIAAVGAVGTATATITKSAIDNFAEYEQLVGGAQLMFGDAYDFIAKKAANAYSTVQMSQNDYLQQVNGFATGLKTALGGNEQAAAELADKIIQAEADVVAATGNSQEAVQNAFNGIMKTNYTMLDNLQIGITPTKEGFQEVIDKVNEWNAANGRATEYQIENLADCQSALVDYIDMVGMSGYAQKEAAGTIQGSISSMKAAWSDWLTSLANSEGNVEETTKKLVNSATQVIENILPVAKRVISSFVPILNEQLPKLVKLAGNLIVENLPMIVESGIKLMKALVTGIVQSLPKLKEAVVTIIKNAFGDSWNTIAETAKKCREALEPAVQAISEGFAKIKEKLSPVIEKLTNLKEKFADAVSSFNASDFLVSVFETLNDVILKVVDGISAFFTWCSEHQTTVEIIATLIGGIAAAVVLVNTAVAIWNGICAIATAVTTGFGAAVAFLTSPITLVVLAIGALIAVGVLLYRHWDEIKAWAAETWENIKSTISEKVSAIKEKVVTTFENIKQGISDKIAGAKEAVVQKFEDIKSGIQEKVEAVKAKVQEIFDGIKSLMPESVLAAKDAVVEKFETMKTDVQEKVSALKEDVAEKFSSIGDGIKTAFENLKEEVGGWVETNIVQPIKEKIEGFFEIGGEIVNKIWGGITGVAEKLFPGLGEKIGEATSGAVEEASAEMDSAVAEAETKAEESGKGAGAAFAKGASQLPEDTKTPVKAMAEIMDKDTSMEEAGQNAIDRAGSIMQSAAEVSGFDSAGVTAMQKFIQGLQSMEGAVMAAANAIAAKAAAAIQQALAAAQAAAAAAAGAGGNSSAKGYATGLDYVPYDEFPAVLHKGEAVLTAKEAAAWRAGKNEGAASNKDIGKQESGNGITIVQNISTVPQTPVEFAATTEAYFTQARWAMA